MPVSIDVFIPFLLASIAVLIVPGPAVTVIVSNSLTHGARAGLLNIAGIQLGLVIIVGLVAYGLSTLLATMSIWFDWVRFIGAAYLVYLGYKIFTSTDSEDEVPVSKSDKSFFWQGFIVILTNPKVFLMFGAFLPPFIDPAGNAVAQVLFLGGTFMVAATILDGIYAITAGRAGQMLSAARGRLMRRLSGGFLIGGGIWLATMRQN